MSVAIVTQLVTQRGAASSVSRQQDHRLILSMQLPALRCGIAAGIGARGSSTGRARIAALRRAPISAG
jgi:hypothetical protein